MARPAHRNQELVALIAKSYSVTSTCPPTAEKEGGTRGELHEMVDRGL